MYIYFPINTAIKVLKSNCHTFFFKASTFWADAFYKSKCPYVCLSVCLSVCTLLRYRLTVFLPPLPEVGCPIFLEIQNPWGKSRIRETKHLSTDADSITDTTVGWTKNTQKPKFFEKHPTSDFGKWGQKDR